jgi:hypothetical protein
VASTKATVRRITFRRRDPDLIATVVRGVGFRYVCECGEQGSRRDTWNDARADMRAHVAEHRALALWGADE